MADADPQSHPLFQHRSHDSICRPLPHCPINSALPGLVIGGIWVWFKHYGQDPTPLTKWWAQNIWPAHHLDNVDELTVEYGRPNIVAPGTGMFFRSEVDSKKQLTHSE